MQPSPLDPSSAPQAASSALVALCAGLLPVWQHHIATSRAQSEVAVTDMLKAFADIGPHMDMAERQSQQITEALNQTPGAVTRLPEACALVLAPLLQPQALPEAQQHAVRQALAMVQQAVDALEAIAKPFHRETLLVAEQVDRMYMGFQYQDRTSQMMTLLEADMLRLHQVLQSGHTAPPSLSDWLRQLEVQYAMVEQHHGNPTLGGVAPGNDETTFF